MTTTATLRVATYNLCGYDSKSRWARQLDFLAGLKADAVIVQELKHADYRGWRRLHQAEEALDMRGVAVKSNHDGCHLTWFVRRPHARIIEERHDQASPWWHAKCGLVVEVHGLRLYLAGVHFAPASPQLRLAEAEACSLIPSSAQWVILAGDMNAFAINDTLPPGEVTEKTRRKSDCRPALALENAGLVDVGAAMGDTTPTVEKPAPYRCDRVHSNSATP